MSEADLYMIRHRALEGMKKLGCMQAWAAPPPVDEAFLDRAWWRCMASPKLVRSCAPFTYEFQVELRRRGCRQEPAS